MTISPDAPEALERDFLNIRARLLELAASLDRIDRAEGSVAADPRMAQIDRAIDILASRQSNRARDVQFAFSLPYDTSWRTTLKIAH